MLKLFRVVVVVLVAIVSIVLLFVLFTALRSVLSPAETGGSAGITAVSGGVSDTLLRAVFLVALLCYLIWSLYRRRSR